MTDEDEYILSFPNQCCASYCVSSTADGSSPDYYHATFRHYDDAKATASELNRLHRALHATHPHHRVRQLLEDIRKRHRAFEATVRQQQQRAAELQDASARASADLDEALEAFRNRTRLSDLL